MPYPFLADLVLTLHVAIVVFIVGGLVAVFVGGALGWRWVRHRSFRGLHLAAIAVVVLQSWLGQWCALTTLESWLRAQAGESGYTRSFVETWLHRLLYLEGPFWAFTLAYTVFGGLVLLAWWRVPPRPGA